ncbi:MULTISPECIES: response regulator transcription factor [Pseudomonas]|uniref:response regulator transcription factor n=1 Tax=Pseudomonas TaxID=286 RepID=UPI0015A446E7|nr:MULTISPECIES: response regulator transcription factor [Pseudomonas]NWA46391.1 response regulator transcription factor [Pseudomonas reactans]NWC39712.1 response regulator transcription factor [Pseudomonas tolaasii]NWC90496.1 response regulator transcription factor [Pseudomonas reactans]NWF17376.1 response regulator transcription factor [Pseudomonas reactans]
MIDKVRVVIADDHPIILLGLKEIIQKNKDFLLVGEANCPSHTISLLDEYKPELLITDFNMPGDPVHGDGLKMIDYILRNHTNTKVVVLTMITNSVIIEKLIDIGVTRVLIKTNFYEQITETLNEILSSPSRANNSRTQTMHAENSSRNKLIEKLTVREYEVLRLFVSGLNISSIALRTNRSVKTVSHQKISAMKKLGFVNDQALISFCVHTNLFG